MSANNTIRLEEITTKIGSGATPRGGAEAYKETGITLIRSLNVYDSVFHRDGLAFIDDDQANELRNVIVEPDDVLLNITGASVARCCMVPPSVLPARVNQHVAIVRADRAKADPRFVCYCLVSPRYKDELLSIAQGGATREALTKEKIQNFEIPDVPLLTQRKIASILSAYDDLIENNTRRIAILEEMAQAIYREWLVNFRFPGNENVKPVDSPLGQIPAGWEVKKLGDDIELPYGKALKAADRKGGDVAVYGSGGIVGYHDEFLSEGPGIIVGRKGNVGSVFWSDIPFYPIDTAFYVKTELPLHYVYYTLLLSQQFLNSDAAVPGLNRNQAYSNPLVVPETGLP